MTTGTETPLAIVPALARLDAVLARAAGIATERAASAGDDPVRRLLDLPAAEPRFPIEDDREPFPLDAERFARLANAFDLDDFDLDLIVLALAPELDLRYERLYAWLQDDAAKRRPTVDLALNLLCADAADRIRRRVHVEHDAPLIRQRLLNRRGDGGLLSDSLHLDEQILHYLLADETIDSRLANLATLTWPDVERDDLYLDPDTIALLPRLDETTAPIIRLLFEGPDRAGARASAAMLASDLNQPLLAFDLTKARSIGLDLAAALPILFREAWLKDAVLFMSGIEELEYEITARSAFHDELNDVNGVVILAGTVAWRSDAPGSGGFVSIPFPAPGADVRRRLWSDLLAQADIPIDAETLESLAGNFRQDADQIADAVASLQQQRTLYGQPIEANELFASARARSGHELAAFARKITPVHRWDDLVLPDDALDQLRELRNRVLHRQRVLAEWGFDRKLPLGRGITVLFTGPSGTGKTMAAEVVAGELGLDLYKIDLATVVSKYIGETEKNLEAVFNAATSANGILFFDEADAIFGKRSEVRDAHDRYANLEIAYLLQKMEQFDGVAILATNLRDHLDDAFLRRLQIVIEFQLPDEVQRERMWRSFFPAQAPRDPAIDYEALALRYRLSGGNIKNIVVSAAYGAAANGGCIDAGHLLQATRREHQKIGRRTSSIENEEVTGHVS